MKDDLLTFEKKVYVQDYSHSDDYPRPSDVYVVNWKNSSEFLNATRVLVVNNLDSYHRREAEIVQVVNHLLIGYLSPEYIYVVNPDDLPFRSKILCKGYAICPNCRSKLQTRGMSGYECARCMRMWTIGELEILGKGLND